MSVNLIVEEPTEPACDLVELARRVYEGLSDKEVDEVEELALDRSRCFDPQTS